MLSISRPASAQAHLNYPNTERLYVATSGTDPVEYGLTLDFIVQRVIEIVRATGDDVAVWLIESGDPPRIVAYVRPAPSSSAVVKYV